MPWTAADAAAHNKKAKGKAAAQWAAVANSVLARTGNDGRAVRAANAAVARRTHGLDSVRGYAAGGKVAETDVPKRSMLINRTVDDPQRTQRTRIPNVYRGKLEPAEMPEHSPTVYPDRTVRI